jgi:hypothetical protein
MSSNDIETTAWLSTYVALQADAEETPLFSAAVCFAASGREIKTVKLCGCC